jgi:formate dehydrogenase maturation protein FdhE
MQLHQLATNHPTREIPLLEIDEPNPEAAANAVARAEVRNGYGHYLQIFHSDCDPYVDALASDLATLTLDPLVPECDSSSRCLNLIFLFGEPGADACPGPVADSTTDSVPRSGPEPPDPDSR